MSLLRYVTHPDVVIDPATPVPRWSLSESGRRQARAMLAQPWIADVGHVVASDETKALEAAQLVADHLDLQVDVRPDTGETDRSATGFVPHERHDALADRFFAEPDESAEGWERAVDAQERIVRALADVVSGNRVGGVGDVMVVGHGAVGTLLFCHLTEQGISRRHDQPGAGHYWTLDRTRRQMLHPWRPIDHLD